MNRPTIEPTKFVNVRTGAETYGVRVYDYYAQSYDNTWDAIPDDDLGVLRQVIESTDEVIVAIFEFVETNEGGVFIGSEWYDWEDIEPVFAEDVKSAE